MHVGKLLTSVCCCCQAWAALPQCDRLKRLDLRGLSMPVLEADMIRQLPPSLEHLAAVFGVSQALRALTCLPNLTSMQVCHDAALYRPTWGGLDMEHARSHLEREYPVHSDTFLWPA